MKNKLSVCVFCGSSSGLNSDYAQAAKELGSRLAREQINVIYGGGSTGLMGQLADATLDAGGTVIGIIPEFLQVAEVGHSRLTELIVTKDMHERKRLMYDKADLFISLPGGTGTFDETIETMTWSQLSVFKKQIILVNIADYWRPFLTLISHGVREGFIHKKNEGLVTVVETPAQVLDLIKQH
ncbi:MAG: TIGR00730 family Rossman fold protein [Alphaproteobacteria bacterium]|nr:TIGR00730 family Rossman fold protein [Alphaproteobacteria bacterium]